MTLGILTAQGLITWYGRRKQYALKRKQKEARTSSPAVVAVPFEKVRENIISQITDLMCRVDWHDHELRNVWTALENLRSLAGKGQTQNLISARTPLVAGGLVGFATGFAIKKIMKLVFIGLGGHVIRPITRRALKFALRITDANSI